MDRLTVLNQIIAKINAKTYLEIGVKSGAIVSEINAPYKVAVDPEFKFSRKLRLKRMLGAVNFKAIEKTSDIFFEKYADRLLPDGIDVAFIDGLHTYEQSKKDFENCLKRLNAGGVIVMHDCNPLNYAGAFPVKESVNEVIALAEKGEVAGWNGLWNGDVWKTIAVLLAEREDLQIFTLDLDWGLGIITRGVNTNRLSLTSHQIQQADFYAFEKNREEFLNLKHPRFFKEFLTTIPRIGYSGEYASKRSLRSRSWMPL